MDPIQWVAGYSDGTSLTQYNADGTENRYPSIDRSKLKDFSLFRDGVLLIRYHFDHPDQRLIYRRRVFLMPGEAEPRVFYLIGWQRNVKGENVQSISLLGVLPSGDTAVEVIGRWWTHPLFESVEHLDCEKEDSVPLALEGGAE
jgi:hypothetical protein